MVFKVISRNLSTNDPQVMLILSSQKAAEKPITVLHTAAMLMAEGADQMERGKFNFNYFHLLENQWVIDSGYDSEELENQLE